MDDENLLKNFVKKMQEKDKICLKNLKKALKISHHYALKGGR